MDYFWLIAGIIGCIVGIVINPLAKERISDGEISHLTVKGYLLSFMLIIMGFILIARELSKII